MYSALKRNGQPLYELARRGETVEREPRDIEIFRLELQSWEPEKLVLDVSCSKGTYIRTLAEDIGEALGCGAHLGGLRRTATGAFRIEEAVSLDTLEALPEDRRDSLLRPVDAVLTQLPEVVLEEGLTGRFCHGQTVTLASVPRGVSRVYTPFGQFLGLGEDGGEGRLVPKRLLAETAKGSPSG